MPKKSENLKIFPGFFSGFSMSFGWFWLYLNVEKCSEQIIEIGDAVYNSVL